MKNHIIFFSGGLSSFSVADYVKKNFPNDNILLYFTDTLWESMDLYRFINEASDKMELPLLTHSMGLTPVQLMFEQKVIFNSRIGNCSKYLKMKVAADYLKKGKRPNIEKWRNKQYLKHEDFTTEAILYFGIGFMESHRAAPIQKNWQPFKVEMPLINQLWFEHAPVLEEYSIRQPILYDYGFSHNNCNGRCVKAGMSHFKRLRSTMPEVFKELVEQEHYLKLYVSEYHYIKNLEVDGLTEDVKALWHEKLDDAYRDYFYGRAKRPKVYIPTDLFIQQYGFMKRKGSAYPLSQFSRDLSGHKGSTNEEDIFDLKHDEGGCGCFVDFSTPLFDESNNQIAINL
ncbi:phosphoadenosine phosphosulfate reductase family protein [Fictibacillus phosphorivorans]|uniref:phosphoadenosine phosphosulfate reductase domain-containing protein n=1 Tax=Fictibacillus phosphorivorans TaxID=1221500 RepID=UPI000ACDE86D|nr:phosphoadenosine phosphosulfate reductase family protein [Fictibacillus phosphorivorans]